MAKTVAKKKDAPKVALLALCDGIGRDPNSKKTTLYGLFDTINVDALPANVSITAYAKVGGGSGKHKAQVDILDQSGRPISKQAPQLEIDLEKDKFTEIIISALITLKRAGRHTVGLSIDGKKGGEPATFVVKKRAKQESK